MVAFSADFPPDGAINTPSCKLYCGGVFPQLVCAHAQIGGRPLLIMQKREGVRSARKCQDCLVSNFSAARRQSNRATVK